MKGFVKQESEFRFHFGFGRVLVVNGPHLSRKLSTARPLTSGRGPDYVIMSCGLVSTKTRLKPDSN